MKFYDRSEELAFLKKQEEKAQTVSQMTIMVGRRRIGKTLLLKKSIENKRALYFFIAKKSEALLVDEFAELVKNKLNIPIYGQLKSFKDLFELLMDISFQEPLTLVLDEFQEFFIINPSVFSDMQNIWDSKKADAKMNLILCGSIYSLMKKVFEDSREPLFGRATGKIHIKPFGVETLKEILNDFKPDYKNADLLAFYAITGGVAKYVENLVNSEAFSLETILDEIFQTNSLFLEEGRNVLIEEFGKDYTTYFSILTLIASSKTSRPEIESILETSVGGFLEKLENDFGIIKRVKPILSKQNSRQIKYKIEDNFLNFWFRFVYKNRSTIEIGNFELIKKVIREDFSTYSGPVLEKYFVAKLMESKSYSTIGTYWERGNQNEIDIVAINEYDKNIMIAEVKLNKNKFNLLGLQNKAKNLLIEFKDFQVEFRCFSVEDM